MAIVGNSSDLAYPLGIRKGPNFALIYERGAILVKISILKGKDLSLRAEAPHKNFIEYPTLLHTNAVK